MDHKNSTKASNIACMDELFLHLKPSAMKEKKHYNSAAGLVKHSGFPGATASVLLCTTGDGILLPPLLAFKVYSNSKSHLSGFSI